MKLCILGADGRTGLEVVNYALSKGYQVVAFVYAENAKKYLPQNIEVHIGDVMNFDAVAKAVLGVDAVVSVLGHIKGSDPLMQTKGTRNIIRAMNEHGVKRFLSLTGTGAREAGDTPSTLDKVLNFFVKLVDPNRINDGIEHVKVLKSSNISWTVVRVLKLSKSEREFKDYVLTPGGPAELQTSRKKVAHILVDLIQDNQYTNKLPVVSG
jgi:putative NADH-flavin reductase